MSTTTLELYVHSFRDTIKSRTNSLIELKYEQTKKEFISQAGYWDPTKEEQFRNFSRMEILEHYPDQKILSSVTNCSIYMNGNLVNLYTSQQIQYSYLQSASSDYQRQLMCVFNFLIDYLPQYNGTQIVIYYNELAIGKLIPQLQYIFDWIKLSGLSDYYELVGTPKEPKVGGMKKFVEYIGHDLCLYNANITKNPSALIMAELLCDLIPIFVNRINRIEFIGQYYTPSKTHNDSTNSNSSIEKNRAYKNQLSTQRIALGIGDLKIEEHLGNSELTKLIFERERKSRQQQRVERAKELSKQNKLNKIKNGL